MERRITTYGGYFEEFIAALDAKVRRKIYYGLDLLKFQDIVSRKFVKYLRHGLFVLFNGFQKKTQKTPEKEIIKALRIKKEYYDGRR